MLTGGGLFVSLACLAWLLLRSGRRPDRLRYPCQQFAAAQSGWLFAGGVAPLALPAPLAWSRKSRQATVRNRRGTGAHDPGLRPLPGPAPGLRGVRRRGREAPCPPSHDDRMARGRRHLSIQPRRAAAADASDIFVAQGMSEDQADQAAASLVAIMAGAGTHFYRSSQARSDCGPDGLIAPDDVVVIKVNAEWRERGMTNTDVIKGLIGAVVNHPDGFIGEIVICENGQWQDPAFMDHPDRNNAYDRTQSYADVAAMYAGAHRVSTYDWTLVRESAVGEFDAGDYTDGYVPVSAVAINYPKFTSTYGTAISMRNGIWNGSAYDNARLKLLNVPVLKSHHYTGVTAACKLFMGFWSTALLGYDPHAKMVFNGYMGRIMAYGRLPGPEHHRRGVVHSRLPAGAQRALRFGGPVGGGAGLARSHRPRLLCGQARPLPGQRLRAPRPRQPRFCKPRQRQDLCGRYPLLRRTLQRLQPDAHQHRGGLERRWLRWSPGTRRR